jgi:hypothetical protein
MSARRIWVVEVLTDGKWQIESAWDTRSEARAALHKCVKETPTAHCRLVVYVRREP